MQSSNAFVTSVVMTKGAGQPVLKALSRPSVQAVARLIDDPDRMEARRTGRHEVFSDI
jgi:hypothetical protein